jgi:hypothetical protein
VIADTITGAAMIGAATADTASWLTSTSQREGPASGAFLYIELPKEDRQAAAANNCQFLGMITASIA